MDRAFDEFWDAAERATEKGKGLKFNRYGKNLRYNSEGIYSYNTKIADLDFRFRSVSKRSSYSATSNKHYNYALRTLSSCYDFYETSPAPPDAPREWLHPVQNLSYDDHT
jgi:hypothetical protein